ncbi:SNF5-domain-containing protein [Eremomyces bilateralis CBS 781.70]|uniref:SNF5-domain-containing protein n=1 Tax=Eremomyces bilateralis CBS 781.70 TaxID=1392243 RepID=A0A6G1GGC3_9PEZI|nr:SNF5-domain-containing protein [Eremomyces bilateralis CBS 781.70]KAF1817064.1 SNF5-domain-containing protein [Eremomyces bilateralis CBS 781.70]
MTATMQSKMHPPQSFMSSYAPRLRKYANPLITPVIPQAQLSTPRTTKRGTMAVNYAEDGFDDTDFDDGEGPRRPTGLRSLRRDDSLADREKFTQLGKELSAPVEVQGIWRDWMGKPKRQLTERQLEIQSVLPLNLIPIRIDLDITPFRPEPALPMPVNAKDFGIDDAHPAYKQQEPTPTFRLKDTFLWNLHEALMTPDYFAKIFVDELDLPNERKPALIMQIANQIRQQLEEYAGVAMHPLFHSTAPSAPSEAPESAKPSILGPASAPRSRDQSSTPARVSTPLTFSTPLPFSNGFHASSPARTPSTLSALPPAPVPVTSTTSGTIAATATPLPDEDVHNPDDTYRCIINLNINLMNRLYQDKFEWSLLHPPGFAEHFAKQTCADVGLSGEWVPAMTHALYEAVLRLKKEACENGGLVGYGEIENDAAEGAESGWRYEPEHLCDEWEPKVEILSKEEIEKREGDRERQIRRIRRETARFSSTSNMNVVGGMAVPQGDYFANPEATEQPMGRGERSKKKRRFRSISPTGRETPEVAGSGYGGGAGGLAEWERQNWRCSHCLVWGSAVWAVRDGPNGPRSLCNNCGFLYERDKKLPTWSHHLFINDRAFGTR